MLNNLSLKNKILAGGLLPLLFVGLINIVGLINFNDVVESYKWVSLSSKVIEIGKDIQEDALNMETGQRGYLLTGDESFLEPYITGLRDYQSHFKEIKLLLSDREALDAINAAEEILNKWRVDVAEPFIKMRRSLDNTPKNLKKISDLVSQKKGKAYFDKFRQEMKIFDTREKKLFADRVKDASNTVYLTNNIIIFGTVLALILAILIAVFIIKIIINPLVMIKEAALKISEGDTGNVTIDINGEDEVAEMANAFKSMIDRLNSMSVIAHKIGEGNLNVNVVKRSENDILGKALENMIFNLNKIMIDLRESTLSLNSATSQILATTTQVSSSASETSSAVAQTSASIEEIKHTAKTSSSKATQIAESTSKTIEIAKSGMDGLIENMKGLNQIKEKMDLIASNIIQLSEQSQLIGEITSTVEDIANQANMLAVNASIEAVKAGEQGKGFSVVAIELKNLADQSKQGTKQVQKILSDIQKVTGTLVMAAEQGSKAVDSGVVQAQNAKSSMDQLNVTVHNAANAGKQIAASYEQELAGMDQISGAMSSVKEATVQNVSSIKQVEISAHNLNSLSQKLKEVMDYYTITESKK